MAFVFVIFKRLVPKINERIEFERKNLIAKSSHSFSKDKLQADYLFHVSSEGELEQSLTLITYYLKQDKKIEIIFTSPSVEKKCLELYQSYPKNVRILRLPILSYFPFNFLYFQSIFQFVTAPTIFMCRYDFFPELLYLKYFGKKLILISAATKNWNNYKYFCFQFFHLIIAATPKEAERISHLVKYPVYFFEFRFLRIFERLDKTEELFTKNMAARNFCQNLINNPTKKIIFGSLWPSDIEIFNDKDLIDQIKLSQLKIVIAPHKLNRDYIDSLKNSMGKYIPQELIAEVDIHNQTIEAPVIFTLLPGMLCELYQFFDVAYIGGGYEKSIHSVLEPFLMGAKVICGSKTHRSTEYDYICEIASEEIIVLNNPNLFYTKYGELMTHTKLFDRNKLKSTVNDKFLEIIHIIG